MLGEIPALFAEFDHRHFVFVFALGAILLFDLPFNRQTVAVPTRNIVRVKAEHLLAACHEILQNLVQRVADMNIAVRVWRAVMQHETRATGGCLTEAFIEVDLRPARQNFRLALRQARAHRKIGLGEKKRL